MEADGKHNLGTWCRRMIADPDFPNFQQFGDGLFQIPWLDQKRSSEWGQDEEYSRILQQYTLYRRPNEVAQKDYPTWKARLRNALSKSKYIERLHRLDVLSGPNPHIVCKFKERFASYDHSSTIDDLTNNFSEITFPSLSSVNIFDNATREPPNTTIGQIFDDSNLDRDYEMLSEDSQSRERRQEFQGEVMDLAQPWTQPSDQMNGHGNVGQLWAPTLDQMNGHGHVGQSWAPTLDHMNGHVTPNEPWLQTSINLNEPEALETPSPSQSIEQLIQTLVGKRMQQTEDSPKPVLIIDVLYDSPYKIVKTFTLRDDVPICRLFAGTVQDQNLQRKIQGAQQEIQFELPDLQSVPDISEKFRSKIENVLSNFIKGVSIKYDNLNIYVQRRCSPPVSFSDDVCKTESLTQKKGAEGYDLIFDYKEFINSLYYHINHPDSPAPKDYVLLIIAGKYLVEDTSPMRRVPIHFKIRHLMASWDLNDCSERKGDFYDFSSMFSTMDSLDREIQAAKDLENALNK